MFRVAPANVVVTTVARVALILTTRGAGGDGIDPANIEK